MQFGGSEGNGTGRIKKLKVDFEGKERSKHSEHHPFKLFTNVLNVSGLIT